MSTSYRALKDISFAALFDGRLEKCGIREKVRRDTTDSLRYLVGGDGILAVYRESDGTCSFERPCLWPVPWEVLDAIQEEFDAELVTEHDHRFWGFESEEEWNASWDAIAKEHEEEYYQDVIKYLRGEPNGLKPGTVGMAQAEFGRELVAKDPNLLAPENRNALLSAIEKEGLVKVDLTDRQPGAADLMAMRRSESTRH